MATTMARNRDDVDNMEVRDRLWDSMNFTYGQKREASDKAFAQAYSQAERSALKRGMQRSSYGQQTLANLDKQKVDAQNSIYDAQIADYESRLYQIEQDELAQQQWQANFDFQQAQADRAAEQWQAQYDMQKQAADQSRLQWEQNFAFQQAQADLAAEQWQKQFDENVRQFNEQLAKKGSGGGGSKKAATAATDPPAGLLPGYGDQVPGSANWFNLLNGFDTTPAGSSVTNPLNKAYTVAGNSAGNAAAKTTSTSRAGTTIVGTRIGSAGATKTTNKKK